MCGIVGYVGNKQVVPVIIDGLRKLEYRGDDWLALLLWMRRTSWKCAAAEGKLRKSGRGEAARNMSAEDIEALAQGVGRHEAEIAGLPAWGVHNALGAAYWDFHFRIARASGSLLLIEYLLQSVLSAAAALPQPQRQHHPPEPRARRAQAILDAIQDRDPELAETTMRRHIRSAGERRAEAMAFDASVNQQPQAGTRRRTRA